MRIYLKNQVVMSFSYSKIHARNLLYVMQYGNAVMFISFGKRVNF